MNSFKELVGMRLLRAISVVITPPAVSIPRREGATSRNGTPFISELWSPDEIAAWIAAP